MYVFKKNIVYLFGLCFNGDNNYPESSIGEFGVYDYITYVKEFEPHDVPASSMTVFRTHRPSILWGFYNSQTFTARV